MRNVIKTGSAASGCGPEGSLLENVEKSCGICESVGGKKGLQERNLIKSIFIPAQNTLLKILPGFIHLGFCLFSADVAVEALLRTDKNP